MGLIMSGAIAAAWPWVKNRQSEKTAFDAAPYVLTLVIPTWSSSTGNPGTASRIIISWSE
jgi:hypothetical protein